MRLAPGTILRDKYQIVREVDERGDGDVFEARHLNLAGRYAVRLLCEGGIRNAVLLDALRREALATSSLTHPGIVRVYDLDQAPDGSPFIVMDYLSGQPLGRVIREAGPMRLADVAAIVEAIASPLGEAHRRGIIHGDLTPESVFVIDAEADTHARVKILGFGVAKIRAEAGGVVRGAGAQASSGYVAPERQGRRASEVDELTDVFALGAIAFALLSGRAPPSPTRSTGTGPVAAREPAPPLAAPPAVAAAVARAMSPRREGRFHSVTDFAQALRKAVSASPARASGVRPARLGATPAVPVPTLHARADRARLSTSVRGLIAGAVGCGLAILLGVRLLAERPVAPRTIAGEPSRASAPLAPKRVPAVVARPPAAVAAASAARAVAPPPPHETRESDVRHHHPSAHAGMSEAARREMEQAYQKATRAFDIERYDEAIVAYKQTYELGGDPPMLYDIAQALRLSKHADEAVVYYRRYLDRAPTAPNRDEVRARIVEPAASPTSTPAKALGTAPAADAR